MKNINNNYFTANKIDTEKIVYGFFSKNGGYSLKNFYSLNCNFNSGDNDKLVKKNIMIAKKNLGLHNKQIKFLKQTHSAKVEMIDHINLDQIIKADGSITKDKKIALAVLTADCAPIFIFDKKNTFICSLHAGWKGCLDNIVKNAVDKINKIQLNSQNLIAVIGPCLSKENFEVDENFKNIFLNKNMKYEKFFSKNINPNKSNFDMRGLINFQLQNCLIMTISNVNFDTYSNNNLFYSRRKSLHAGSLPTGRMINLIGFKDSF